jgi:crossover junction endodeoxyribonuclease RuvC
MRRYLGIDPGVSGAYALLALDEDRPDLSVSPTPVLWTAAGGGKRRRYNVPALWAQLTTLPPVTLAFLEQQSARPGQGVTSMFSTGEGYGIWLALLTAAAIPFVIVPPIRWRYLAGLPSQPKGSEKKAVKEAVRLAACRRFPRLVLKLDHADAVMMAVAAAHANGTDPQRWSGESAGGKDELKHQANSPPPEDQSVLRSQARQDPLPAGEDGSQ